MTQLSVSESLTTVAGWALLSACLPAMALLSATETENTVCCTRQSSGSLPFNLLTASQSQNACRHNLPPTVDTREHASALNSNTQPQTLERARAWWLCGPPCSEGNTLKLILSLKSYTASSDSPFDRRAPLGPCAQPHRHPQSSTACSAK